jgi:hypothetical protein
MVIVITDYFGHETTVAGRAGAPRGARASQLADAAASQGAAQLPQFEDVEDVTDSEDELEDRFWRDAMAGPTTPSLPGCQSTASRQSCSRVTALGLRAYCAVTVIATVLVLISTRCAEQKAEQTSGYNRQHKQQAPIEPKMHTVNHRVLSALMPQGGTTGVAAGTGISAAVHNEIRKAEASSTTSVVHIKDKKVRTRHILISATTVLEMLVRSLFLLQ